MRKRKILIVILIFIFSLFLSACDVSSSSIDISSEKKGIVQEKYGDLEYVNTNITINNNLEHNFRAIFGNLGADGFDYIINNKGRIPLLNEDDILLKLDIVLHENKYKILVYNNIIKKSANKTKMFILLDYYLDYEIDLIKKIIKENELNQDLSNFRVLWLKKDQNNYNDFDTSDELSKALYFKASNNSVLISFYDPLTNNLAVKINNNFYFANTQDEKVYYPEKINYHDLMNDKYNTLNDEKIDFSLNNGLSFVKANDRLEEFDIWHEALNSENRSVVFFYASTYPEFVAKIEEIKNPNIYTYNYPDEKGFNNLIKNYNEDYFEENSLLFYYRYEPNISENYIYAVTKKDNVLTLNVNRFEGMATALSSWFYLVTLKKADIGEVEHVDLIVRTITALQDRFTLYVKGSYMRDFYLKPKTLEDFKDIRNLVYIDIFTWSLSVDIIFGKNINDDDLAEVVSLLEKNPNIKSLGYKGRDFIRAQLNNNFYDAVINKTLVLKDFLDKNLINDYNLSIEILTFAPIASITFLIDEKGKDKVALMLEDFRNGNYPYLIIEDQYYN